MKIDERPATRERLGLLLVRHGQFVNIQIRKAMASTGLTPRHRQVLLELAKRGPTSQQSLIESLGVDASALVSILNDLERLGLAQRRRDPADRRRHIVEMSGGGREALRNVEQAVSQAEAELFADLDQAEREQLHELLGKMRTIPEDAGCQEVCDGA